MKGKLISLIKWIFLFTWLGTPIVFSYFGVLIIHEELVIPWIGLCIFGGFIQYGYRALKLTNFLQTNYPADYQRITTYKNGSIKSVHISKRFDMLFEFSPFGDETFSNIKYQYKDALYFVFSSFGLSIIAFVSYVM